MLSDVLSALVDVFSFVVHAEFEVGVLPLEEFRWKIFLGEDLEQLVVLVSFVWIIVRDSPLVNFVSQTMNKHIKMLPGNAKCSMTSLADTKHIFQPRCQGSLLPSYPPYGARESG